MADLPESFQYILKNPIKYHTKDGMEDFGKELTIHAPSPSSLNDIALLDAEFTKSMMSSMEVFSKLASQDNKSKQPELFDGQEKDEDKGSQTIMIMMAGDADIIKCYNCLRNVLTSGSEARPVCLLEDVSITSPLYDKISIRDKKAILGEYLANFIAGSLLS